MFYETAAVTFRPLPYSVCMKMLILLLAVCPAMLTAQEIVDGPYIFYRNNDSALVRTIQRQGDLDKAITQVYATADLPKLTLTVPVAGHPEWAFPVTLQPAIASPAAIYPMPEQLFVLSDIEGEFAAGRQLLIAGQVIDEQYNWTFGKGHLVIAGDLFDRGPDVLPWLWLLYSLEAKAKAAGGLVQVILGNHDIMQLSGDYRYTDARYFKNAWLLGRDIRSLFGTDTELGRWLRSKNIIEKTGDYLVMHAGLSPEVLSLRLSLDSMNKACRPYYATGRREQPEAVQVFFGAQSPFWYRGYFGAPLASMAHIDSTLQQYGCHTIIAGHTITDTTIVTKYDGKVIGIDVNEHEGQHKALLISSNRYTIVDEKGNRMLLSLSKE